jgi:hypothetical protein
MINEVGKFFMLNGIEYKITYVDEKKKRLNVELNNFNDNISLHLNDAITIENKPFIVTYINEGKKRISLQLIEKGV